MCVYVYVCVSAVLLILCKWICPSACAEWLSIKEWRKHWRENILYFLILTKLPMPVLCVCACAYLCESERGSKRERKRRRDRKSVIDIRKNVSCMKKCSNYISMLFCHDFLSVPYFSYFNPGTFHFYNPKLIRSPPLPSPDTVIIWYLPWAMCQSNSSSKPLLSIRPLEVFLIETWCNGIILNDISLEQYNILVNSSSWYNIF